jgi:UDPglucose 6-dehydrogenase
MRIAIVGCGYVGLVTGAVFADLGNEVVCVDNDLAKLDRLRRGEPTIYEPGLEELLRRTVGDGNLRFTDSIADATRASEIVFITVGTPAREDGIPDMAAVSKVAREIARAIDKPTVVVNKSTVPVGSGDLVEGILRAEGAPDGMFDVVSNPEFLREGSAIHDTLNPDRVIIGAKRREAANKLVELYSALERPMHVTDPNSAELIKYASNCFLATKISFANALSRLCELAGADVGDVAKGMGADRRIGHEFLNAGLGWGGSCLPKDVLGLITTSDRLGYDFELLRAAWNVNAEQPRRFLERLESRLGGFRDKVVGVLGLSFKPNTDDIREAPSLAIIAEILGKGGSVAAFDPAAMDRVRKVFPGIRYAAGPYDAAEGADAVLLVTEWNEFKQVDLKRIAAKMRGNLLFDGRRVYGFAAAERAGLEYHTIGASRP